MTVYDFLENFGNNARISIEGYCEEKGYDYLIIAEDQLEEFEEELQYRRDHDRYIPRCLYKERWWDDVKDREIKEWNVLGLGMKNLELWIVLK